MNSKWKLIEDLLWIEYNTFYILKHSVIQKGNYQEKTNRVLYILYYTYYLLFINASVFMFEFPMFNWKIQFLSFYCTLYSLHIYFFTFKVCKDIFITIIVSKCSHWKCKTFNAIYWSSNNTKDSVKSSWREQSSNKEVAYILIISYYIVFPRFLERLVWVIEKKSNKA